MIAVQRKEQLFLDLKKEGFPLIGIVDLALAEKDHFLYFEHYQNWIQSQFHGEMLYLERGLERRKDPRNLFLEAKSILAVGLPYSASPIGPPQYARYMRGGDYHKEIPKKLESALQKVKKDIPEFRYKICVDTSALLERTWGALCGLGWIGKNGMLIHPEWGSYFLLGFALLNVEWGLGPELFPNWCGSCQRCISGCPTQAIIKEKTIDSKKCISYLTLEKRGPFNADDSTLKKMGTWIAGCDICQEVCPFNFKRAKKETEHSEDVSLSTNWDDLSRETKDQYLIRVKNSALNRIKYEDFKRNFENYSKNLKP